jgi:hypothetical protein
MSPASPIEMPLAQAVVAAFGGRAMTVIQMSGQELTRLRIMGQRNSFREEALSEAMGGSTRRGAPGNIATGE